MGNGGAKAVNMNHRHRRLLADAERVTWGEGTPEEAAFDEEYERLRKASEAGAYLTKSERRFVDRSLRMLKDRSRRVGRDLRRAEGQIDAIHGEVLRRLEAGDFSEEEVDAMRTSDDWFGEVVREWERGSARPKSAPIAAAAAPDRRTHTLARLQRDARAAILQTDLGDGPAAAAAPRVAAAVRGMNVAGSGTFRKAWRALHLSGLRDRDDDYLELFADARRDLARARVVRARREQVAALPAIPAADLGAHLGAAGLPFQQTYVDLDATPLSSGAEIIGDTPGGIGVEATGALLTTDWEGHVGGVAFGRFVAARCEPLPLGAFRRYLPDDRRPPDFEAQEAAAGAASDFGVCPLLDLTVERAAWWGGAEYADAWHSLFAIAVVERAVAVLFLIDAANVELEERAESRQVRRQAERDGEQIALQVVIRPPRSRPAREGVSPSPGPRRDFSHRFEVRGHYRHVARGPHVKDPSKTRPCPRCGRCRREWCPPHVRGPEDKPLVPKRRVLADDAAESEVTA